MSLQYLFKEHFFFLKTCNSFWAFSVFNSSGPRGLWNQAMITHTLHGHVPASPVNISAFESPPSERHCQTSRLDLHKQLPVRLEKYLSFASQQHYSKTFTYINSHLHFPKKCVLHMQQFFISYSVFCHFKTFGYLVKGKRQKVKAADSTPSVQMCNTSQTTGETEKQAHFKAMSWVG